MKKKIILVLVALIVTVTGCGSKGKNTESQQKVAVKDVESEKAENQKKNTKKDTEKSEESGSKKEEIIVKEDEKAVLQQTVPTDNNSSDTNTSSNGNTANNNGSGNTAGNGNVSSTSGSHTGNGSSSTSGSTSSGGSSSGGSSNSSNGNSTPVPEPAQPVHTHTWVHVDVAGHYETVTIQEAYDEEVPVYSNVEHSICNVCGADITSDPWGHTQAHALAYEGGGYHSEWRYEQTGTQTIHHEAVTENRWVEDSPAYDICSGCGLTR